MAFVVPVARTAKDVFPVVTPDVDAMDPHHRWLKRAMASRYHHVQISI
jgi:hypothetical protein